MEINVYQEKPTEFYQMFIPYLQPVKLYLTDRDLNDILLILDNYVYNLTNKVN